LNCGPCKAVPDVRNDIVIEMGPKDLKESGEGFPHL